MPKFCTDFNIKKSNRRGEIVHFIITSYNDNMHSFEIKANIIPELLLKLSDCEIKKL